MNRAIVTLDPARVELFDTREGWEAGRRAGEFRIGASVVGSILTRPWEAFEELTGQAPEPDAATLRTFARGHRWERYIVEEYAAAREVPTLPAAEALGAPAGSLVIVRHPTEAWACSSPDAITADPTEGPGLVECKTDAGGQGWAEADCELRTVNDYHEAIAPAGYLTQAYWQLLTTGLPFVDLVCLLPRYALRVVRVWADPDTQAEILDAVADFRARHLLPGEPPPVDGSGACKRLLTKRFPGVGKERRPATSEEAALVLKYADAKAREKAAKEEADALRNQIAASLGDTYGLEVAGGSALLIPMKGRRTVPLTELEKAAPELFATLVARGFVNTGEPFRELRTYGL